MAIPAITNNSPALGNISWAAFNIQYNGVAYQIAAGSTALRWVWWRYNGGSSVIEAGDNIPDDLTDDDLVLFANKNGTGVRVQSTSFVDGELLVDGSVLAQALNAEAVTTDHLLAGDALVQGLLQVQDIVAKAVQAAGLDIGSISIDMDNGIRIGLTNGGVIQFPADGSAAVISGADAVLTSLTTKDRLRILGLINEVGNSSRLYLANGVSNPSVPAKVTSYYDPGIPFNSMKGFGYYLQGLGYDETMGCVIFALSTPTIGGTSGSSAMYVCDPVDGEIISTWGLNAFRQYLAVCKVGSKYYALCRNDGGGTADGEYYVQEWDPNTKTRTNQWTLISAATAAGMDYDPTMGLDLTNGGLAFAWLTGKPGSLKLASRSVTGAVNGTDKTVSSYDLGGVTPSHVIRGALDYGDGVVRWLTTHLDSTVTQMRAWSDAATPVRRSTDEWKPHNADSWDGNLTPTPDFSKWYSMDNASTPNLYTYNGINAYQIDVGYAWYDSDPAGSGTHESMSTRATTAFPRRAKLQVDTPPPADTGDADAPDSIRVYATTVIGGTMYLQATLAPGVTSAKIPAVVNSGTASQLSNGFVAAGIAPGGVESSAVDANNKALVSILGDGSWRFGPISSLPNGQAQGSPLVPIGAMLPFAGATAPFGYLLCDGSTFSSTTYPDLAAVLGDTYGVHSGTTYYLPNTSDRFLSGAGSARPRGASGGSDTVTMPDHTHPVAAHDHGVGAITLSKSTNTTTGGSATRMTDISGRTGSEALTTGNVSGTNPPINNVPKYLGVNYIIRAA